MATKSDPFSIRLSRTTDELIEREARRTRRSKGAIVEALAEDPEEIDEAIRDSDRPLEELRREFPAIDTIEVR